MKFRSLVCALASALGVTTSHSAILFIDSPNDANSTYGSFESISGLGAPQINGTAGFFLEGLDAGLAWSNFKLTVFDVTDETSVQPAASASINGVAASSVEFATQAAVSDPVPFGLPVNVLSSFGGLYNVYRFSFSGLVLGGGTTNSLVLGGFNTTAHAILSPLFFFPASDGGGAVLTATAVPEPSRVALLLAGLAAIGWVARRKSPGRTFNG